MPQDLAPGATYTCTFEGRVAGNEGDTHTNEVTGTAIDNEENTAIGKDKADVAIPTRTHAPARAESDVRRNTVTQRGGFGGTSHRNAN